MDRPIKASRWSSKSIIAYFGLLACVFIITSAVIWSRNVLPRVSSDDIKIGTAEYDDFQEIVVSSGTVEPKTSVLVDVREGGTIEEIYVEDGQEVKAGQALLRLHNQTLILDYMQRETLIVEQINNLRNTRIGLHTNQRAMEDRLNELSYQVRLLHRQFDIDSGLYAQKVISEQNFFETQLAYNLANKQHQTLEKRRITDLLYMQKQLDRIDQTILMMERNLQLLRTSIAQLSVTAPVSGQLNSFDFEPGQTLLKNQNAGRIDDLSEYIITCMVDQHYLPRVRENLQAHIESDKQSYSLYISKVLPTVVNGQFEIKLSFNDSLPVHLRRGQIFQVLIQISARKKVVMIPKGSYYQSSGGKFLYVLSRDEKRAVKREVRLGTQNQSHYEVISGLDEGDRFISSSYEVFEQSELIEIVK